jgi:hypothetical protein
MLMYKPTPEITRILFLSRARNGRSKVSIMTRGTLPFTAQGHRIVGKRILTVSARGPPAAVEGRPGLIANCFTSPSCVTEAA